MKEVLAKAESKMGKTIARLESDYAAIRAGRAIRLCSIRSWSITTAHPRRSTSLQPFPLRRHAC
mgnify:CR=1 FL=1